MSSQEQSGGNGWHDVREQVLNRDNHECRFCGVTDDEHREEHGAGLDVHHIIPEADGGKDKPHNLAALCRSCHRTMETLHGKAMSEVAESEDHTRTLKGLNSTYREFRDIRQEYDNALFEFIQQNPVFKQKFLLFDENGDDKRPWVESHELRKLASELDGEITSEWECAVKFGYKEGVSDVVCALDGRTCVIIEPVEDSE